MTFSIDRQSLDIGSTFPGFVPGCLLMPYSIGQRGLEVKGYFQPRPKSVFDIDPAQQVERPMDDPDNRGGQNEGA